MEGTGHGSLSDLGRIVQWQGNSSLSYLWNATLPIQGNQELQFAPWLSTNGNDRLMVFDDHVMLDVPFHFTEKRSLLGVDLLRYRADDSLFANDDPIYYGPGLVGLININPVAKVQFGVPAPAFASRPYYAGADPILSSQIICSNCPDTSNVLEFDSFVDVEPYTGKTVRGSKKVQVNGIVGQNYYRVKENPWGNIRYQYVPALIFEFSATMGEQQAKQVRDGVDKIRLGQMARTVSLYVGAIVGPVLLLLGAYFLYRWRKRSSDTVDTLQFQQLPSEPTNRGT